MRQNDLYTLHARDLRQNITAAERALWLVLRDRRFLGLKFRRQVPLGPYIVDFFCAERRLIVEADGGQHAENPMDRSRDVWMVAQGFSVVRLCNTDILTNLPGCLQHLSERVAL